MNSDKRITIEELVADLRPTPPFRPRRGLALVALAAGAAVAVAATVWGLRADLLSGRFEPIFLIGNGLLLLLAAAAASTAVAMASPQVGKSHDAWRWCAAMAAILPVSVAVLLLTGNAPRPGQWMSENDLQCLVRGVGLASFTALALIAWLRRGAPVSPERAGLVAGTAAGSAGMLAFALHCPIDGLYHVGVWHAVPVLAGAILGRLIVPPLIRW